MIRTIRSVPPIGDFDLIGHRNVHCVQLGPGSSALPPADNDLDEDAWVDPSTSASPSVSAPHRSPNPFTMTSTQTTVPHTTTMDCGPALDEVLELLELLLLIIVIGLDLTFLLVS